MAILVGAKASNITRTDVLKVRQRVSLRAQDDRVIVSKWPRRRGKPKSPLQQAWVDRFSCMAQAFSSPEPRTRDAAEYWAKSVDIETARPIKGSGWFYRDVLVRAAINNLIQYQDEVRVRTPTALVTRLTNQTFTNGQFANLIATAEVWDNNLFWTAGSNPDRLKVKSPGLYLVGATVARISGATGFTAVELYKNGSELFAGQRISTAGSPQYINVSGITYFQANDYCTLAVFNSNVTANYQIQNWWILAITPEGLVP